MNMQFGGGWIASLSNGETVYETQPEEGKPTPWQGLIERTRNETHTTKNSEVEVPLTITMMRLQYGPLMVQAMPHQMCDGYFQAREALHVVYRNIDVNKHGIGSVVGDNVFITWIEMTPTGQFYVKSEVRPLESCKVHTTVK